MMRLRAISAEMIAVAFIAGVAYAALPLTQACGFQPDQSNAGNLLWSPADISVGQNALGIACPSFEAFGGGVSKTASQNSEAWATFTRSAGTTEDACISFRAGHYEFNASDAFALRSAQKLALHGSGMGVTHLDFQGPINGIVVTMTNSQPEHAHLNGNSVDIRDLTISTNQTGGGHAAISLNGHSTTGNPMQQTNIEHVMTAGGAAADYWSKDIDVRDVQNVHVFSIETMGCAGCDAASTDDVHFSYHSSQSNSNATQLQITDWYANWGGIALLVTGYPQGITVANANWVGFDYGGVWETNLGEAVCNFNNVQINSRNSALKLTNCLQGSIMASTLYAGAFGKETSSVNLLDLFNCNYMTVVGNNFYGVRNNGFTPNGAVFEKGTSHSFLGGNVFNGMATNIIVLPEAIANTIGPNTHVNGNPIVDRGTSTYIYDEYPWANYRPEVACGSGSLASYTATGHYQRLGKSIFVQIELSDKSNGTCATNFSITLPIPAGPFPQILSGREIASGKVVTGLIDANASSITLSFYDGTFIGGNGYKHVLGGVYQSN